MKKSQKQLLCSLIGSAILLGLPSSSWAAETDSKEYSFDEFVITANRIPVKKAEIAASVTVITAEQIVKSGAVNVPEVLRKNNVDMQHYNSATVPVLNGDDRVLVLVDGRRMSWSHLAVSGNDHVGMVLDNMPVENIARIEIVRGPASSLYGSDAAGGIINIITRKADSSKTSVLSEFGSWGFERYSLTTQGKSDDISYFLTVQKKRQGNVSYKQAATGEIKTQPDTYYNQENVSLRLDKELNEGRSISFQYDFGSGKNGFGGYVKNDGTSGYPGGYMTSKDNNVAVTYHWGQAAGADNSLRYYHNQATQQYYNSLVGNYDLTADGLDWQQSWKLNDKHTLVGGSEWRQEKLNDHDSINKIITTGAVFAEDRWKLPHNWTLSLGTRYDDHSVSGGNFTSRITANREIDAKSNMFVSWGQYIKNPTLAQMYTNNGFMKGNLNLKPEDGNTITVGYNTELAGGTKLQVSAYRSEVKNAIDWAWRDWDNTGNPASSYTKYINVDQQKRRGLDLSLSRQLSPKWTVGAGYSYVHIENKANTDLDYSADPRNAQPNGYHLNVEYTQDKWNSSLTLHQAAGRDLAKFTSTSYTTLDLVVNYQMSPTTKAFFKGNNLTNAAYETTGNLWTTNNGDYPMPSRSFYLGVEHKI